MVKVQHFVLYLHYGNNLIPINQVNVSGPGVYKFQDSGSNGQHCSIRRMSGQARVVRHERPSVLVSRNDCQGPVYAVISGVPPFSLVSSAGQLNSSNGVLQLDFSNTDTFFISEVRDSYCASSIGLEVSKPQTTQVHVSKENGAARVDVLASSDPPIVLSYWKTNVSLVGLHSNSPATHNSKVTH